jgi:hypothetical protein
MTTRVVIASPAPVPTSSRGDRRVAVAIQEVDSAGPGANVGLTNFLDFFGLRAIDDAVPGLIRASCGGPTYGWRGGAVFHATWSRR